jgi:transglutaminase-like putative cysteine protease
MVGRALGEQPVRFVRATHHGIAAIFTTTLLATMSALSLAATPAEPRAYLVPTPSIDIEAPSLRAAVTEATRGATTELKRAVRIHDYVRDHVAFGWTGRFHDMRASEVLAAGRGYCNTKGTLFVAMLRAAGIPARQRFISIRTAILRGILDTGRQYVDHSYAEVLLGGRWIAVDSYIVDQPLFRAASAKLAAESALAGYGIHSRGTTRWDGTRNAFSQFVNDGSVPDLSDADHGVFADVLAFYRTDKGVDRPSLPARLLFPLLIRSANENVARIRGQM